MLRKIACLSLLIAVASWAQEVRVRVEGPKDPVHPGATFDLEVYFEIPDGYHIYGPKETRGEPTDVDFVGQAGFTGGPAVYPATVGEEMPGLGTLQVYEDQIEVRVPVTVDPKTAEGEYELAVKVLLMACTKDNCLPTYKGSHSAKVHVAGAPVQPQPPGPSSGTKVPAPPKGKFQDALQKGLLSMLLIAFGAGLAGTLTPCVYPVIPVTISFFGSVGQGQQSLVARVTRGFAYFSGIALFYGVLGLIAATLSLDVAPLLGNPWVVGVLSLIFLTLSLSMFGLYEMNLPPSLMDKLSGRRQGLLGAFVLGALMSLVAMPCVGPFVGGIFAYASTSGNRLVSFGALLTFGVGLGFPFLFLSIFAGSIQALPKAGEWMNRLKTFFGFVMLAMILYFWRTFLPPRWMSVIGGVLAVFWGTYTGGFNTLTRESSPGAKFGKALGILLILAGAALFAKGLLFEELTHLSTGSSPEAEGRIHWQTGLHEALERAKSAGRPVLIDFTADN